MATRLALFVVFWSHEALGANEIAGYKFATNVVNKMRMDLDLAEMAVHIHTIIRSGDGTSPFNGGTREDLAQRVYTQGGHACLYGELSVLPLQQAIPAGDYVFQSRQNDWKRSAQVLEAAPVGSTKITVVYTSLWRPCFGGGSSETSTTGAYGVKMNLTAHCLDAQSPLHLSEGVIGTPLSVSHKFQSFAELSTTAGSRMAGEEEYELRRSFYGADDYAHQFILSFLEENAVQRLFDPAPAFSYPFARGDLVRKIIVYMSLWMEVVHQMEKAIGTCMDADAEDMSTTCTGVACEAEAIQAWDSAAAYYVGSSSETRGGNILLNGMADLACRDFGTCSEDGIALVNKRIFRHFKQGQAFLQGAVCDDLIAEKEHIVKLMYVPMVQNLLRNAFALATEEDIRRDRVYAAFFAKVLEPKLQKCSPSTADLIRQNVLVAGDAKPMTSGFTKVKAAIEEVYSCMGIHCSDIGGIMLADSERIGTGSLYEKGAEPCGQGVVLDDSEVVEVDESGVPVWLVACIAAALLIIAFLGFIAAWRCGFKRGTKYKRFERPTGTGGSQKAATIGQRSLDGVVLEEPKDSSGSFQNL